MVDAKYWIEKLGLTKHIEGGYFRETYRSTETIQKNALPDRFIGDRSFSTAIYFLLKDNEVSQFHRIQQDEVWHFYAGGPIAIHSIDESGTYSETTLGCDFEKNETFQLVLKSRSWFGAHLIERNSYSLVGCTAAPGFDFADFELADRKELLSLYPEHQEIIKKLTK